MKQTEKIKKKLKYIIQLSYKICDFDLMVHLIECVMSVILSVQKQKLSHLKLECDSKIE